MNSIRRSLVILAAVAAVAPSIAAAQSYAPQTLAVSDAYYERTGRFIPATREGVLFVLEQLHVKPELVSRSDTEEIAIILDEYPRTTARADDGATRTR